ncbi:MAG: prepilin peptidase [Actinomycetota bacterium]
MDVVSIALIGILGLALGSFANVVVYRVPRRESVVAPRSRCPSCATTLAWWENVPVVSWVLLRARCRTCRAPISWRYPAVELLTGGLFVLTAARLDRASDLVAYLPLVWVLIVLSFIDLEHKLLPNRIVYPSIGIGVALFGIAAAVGPGLGAWVRALGAGGAAFGLLLGLALAYPAGMGMGDVKLVALLGMSLGYLPDGWGRLFVGLMLAFTAGAVGGIALIVLRRGGMKSQVPFGPYLAAGTLAGILWGGALLDIWLRR